MPKNTPKNTHLIRLEIPRHPLKIARNSGSENIGQGWPRLARHSSHELTIPICPSDFPFPDYLRAPLPAGSGARLRPRTAHRRPTEGSGIDHAEILTFAPAGGTTAPAGAVARARAPPLSLALSLSLSPSLSIDKIFSIQREHVTDGHKDDNIIPAKNVASASLSSIL